MGTAVASVLASGNRADSICVTVGQENRSVARLISPRDAQMLRRRECIDALYPHSDALQFRDVEDAGVS